MEEFRKLGLISQIVKVIEEERFEKPSEIQEKAIPLVIEGKDVIAGSATGSGKTLVFGAGIIQNLQTGNGIKALILTPTRELAEQNSRALIKFSRYKKLNIVPIYGGVSLGPQTDKLRSADVVVGTPGRILDHLERRSINLSRVNILVLDEADRMLDMGFIEDVEKIISQCPRQRQTLLFSATISPDIDYLCNNYMKNPIKVSAEVYVDSSKMEQVYYDAPNNMKFSLLVHLLNEERAGLVMVFCNTRKNTDFVAKNLKHNGIDATAIHGGLSQNRRNHVITNFHAQDVHVLVCTDVAARGLDIKNVSHVYNYDIPKDSKEYIHRIGRTARAGQEGKVVNILSERDHENFSRVLRDNDVDVKKQEMPQVERVSFRQHPRGARQGFQGHRGRDRFGQRDRFGGRRDRFRTDGPRQSFGNNRPRERFGNDRQGQRFGRDSPRESFGSQNPNDGEIVKDRRPRHDFNRRFGGRNNSRNRNRFQGGMRFSRG